MLLKTTSDAVEMAVDCHFHITSAVTQCPLRIDQTNRGSEKHLHPDITLLAFNFHLRPNHLHLQLPSKPLLVHTLQSQLLQTY